MFHDIHQQPGHPTKGRKWTFPSDELGLMLFFWGSTMHYKHLCLLVTASAYSCELNNMIHLIMRCLQHNEIAEIEFSNLP